MVKEASASDAGAHLLPNSVCEHCGICNTWYTKYSFKIAIGVSSLIAGLYVSFCHFPCDCAYGDIVS